jgi:hypothetical protein
MVNSILRLTVNFPDLQVGDGKYFLLQKSSQAISKKA